MSSILIDWVAPILFWGLVITYFTVRAVKLWVRKNFITKIKVFIMTVLKDFVKWIKSLRWKLLKLWGLYIIVTTILDTIVVTLFGDLGKVGDTLTDKWENGTLISSSTVKALHSLWELLLTFLKSIGLIVIKTIMPVKVDDNVNHGILFVVAIAIIIIIILWIKHLFKEKEIWDNELREKEIRSQSEREHLSQQD